MGSKGKFSPVGVLTSTAGMSHFVTMKTLNTLSSPDTTKHILCVGNQTQYVSVTCERPTEATTLMKPRQYTDHFVILSTTVNILLNGTIY